MIWFVKYSYRYVAPRGLIEHIKFLYRIPGASFFYWNALRRDKFKHRHLKWWLKDVDEVQGNPNGSFSDDEDSKI